MNINFFNQKILSKIESLGDLYKADVSKSLEILEKFGHSIELPHSRSLGKGLFELRCLATGIRLFYIFNNDQAVILHFIIKKQNQIPKKDLELTRTRQKMVI